MDLHETLVGQELDVFRSLVRETSRADLRPLRGRVTLHLDSLEERSFSFEFLDVDLGRRLAKGVAQLLDEADAFDPGQRAILRAGVEYFVLSSDADDDLSDPLGLEDDARVFNFVCRSLGRPELQVDLAG